MAIDLARLAAGEQILPRDRPEARRVETNRLLAAGNRQSAHQLAVPRYEGRHKRVAGRLADAVGDVDREEVARIEEAIDRLQPDVVGIDKPRMGPVACRHGSRSRRPHARRLAADEAVLTVRLVPDGGDDHARRSQPFERSELSLGLMGEAVTDAKGKTRKGHVDSGCENGNGTADALSLFPAREAMMILDRRIAILDFVEQHSWNGRRDTP